jgi:hypothetical protein
LVCFASEGIFEIKLGEIMGAVRFAAWTFCLLGLVVFGGCGGGPADLHAISGTVTVDGAPLEQGNIAFEPMESQRTGSGAVVSAGKFSVPRERGLPEGKFRVVVNAPVPGTGGKAASGLPGEATTPPTELIPKEWNEASTHSIEVKKQGPFVFPIEIATKGK